MMNLYKAGVRTLIVVVLLMSLAEKSYSKIDPSTKKKSAAIKIFNPAPDTCSGDVNLTTQAEVNAFPVTYGCSEIAGSLTISGNDITNLDSLHFVTKVDMDLTISNNPNLESIIGLSSLTYVGAGGGAYPGIHITNNPSL